MTDKPRSWVAVAMSADGVNMVAASKDTSKFTTSNEYGGYIYTISDMAMDFSGIELRWIETSSDGSRSKYLYFK